MQIEQQPIYGCGIDFRYGKGLLSDVYVNLFTYNELVGHCPFSV